MLPGPRGATVAVEESSDRGPLVGATSDGAGLRHADDVHPATVWRRYPPVPDQRAGLLNDCRWGDLSRIMWPGGPGRPPNQCRDQEPAPTGPRIEPGASRSS